MFGQGRESQNALAVINPNLKKLHEFYTSAIRDCLGCFSTIDKDDDIRFKYGSIGELFISCDEKDLRYFRLVDLVKIGATTTENEQKALKAINAICQLKCAKLSVSSFGGTLVLTNCVEAFLAPSGELPSKEVIYGTLERYADVLVTARQHFSAELEKLGGLE